MARVVTQTYGMLPGFAKPAPWAVQRSSDKLSAESLAGASIPLISSSPQQGPCFSQRVRSFGDLRNRSEPDLRDLSSSDDSSSSDSSSSSSDDQDTSSSSDAETSFGSFFNHVLLGQWEHMAQQGMFRYDVSDCSTKVVPGRFHFVAQLNEGRATKKRPTEFRADRVVQDFDDTKFNFSKISQQEVLFQFESSVSKGSRYVEDAAVSSNPNLVLINVSPIEYGHVLLVPRVLEKLPQQIQPELLLPAMEMVQEADNPYFRAGYNSLGAYATINHLHFQAYYLMAPFPVERADTELLPGTARKWADVTVSTLVDFPVRGLVFEAGAHTAHLQQLAEAVGEACVRLQDLNVPFNLLIVDRGARVFLLPQCYAERQAAGLVSDEMLDTQVNPACFEISGHLVLKRQEDYDNITEEFAQRLLSGCSLTGERFREMCAAILQ